MLRHTITIRRRISTSHCLYIRRPSVFSCGNDRMRLNLGAFPSEQDNWKGIMRNYSKAKPTGRPAAHPQCGTLNRDGRKAYESYPIQTAPRWVRYFVNSIQSNLRAKAWEWASLALGGHWLMSVPALAPRNEIFKSVPYTVTHRLMKFSHEQISSSVNVLAKLLDHLSQKDFKTPIQWKSRSLYSLSKNEISRSHRIRLIFYGTYIIHTHIFMIIIIMIK